MVGRLSITPLTPYRSTKSNNGSFFKWLNNSSLSISLPCGVCISTSGQLRLTFLISSISSWVNVQKGFTLNVGSGDNHVFGTSIKCYAGHILQRSGLFIPGINKLLIIRLLLFRLLIFFMIPWIHDLILLDLALSFSLLNAFLLKLFAQAISLWLRLDLLLCFAAVVIVRPPLHL